MNLNPSGNYSKLLLASKNWLSGNCHLHTHTFSALSTCLFGALCTIFKIQLNFFSKSFAAYVFHASVVYYVIGAFFLIQEGHHIGFGNKMSLEPWNHR